MTDGVHIRLTLSAASNTPPAWTRPETGWPDLIVLAEFKAPVYDKNGVTLITGAMRRFPPDCLDPKIHHCNLIQSILVEIRKPTSPRGRRAHARFARLRGRNERHAHLSGPTRRGADVYGRGVSRRNYARRDPGPVPAPRRSQPGKRPFSDGSLSSRRSILHGNNGRNHASDPSRRPDHRRRLNRPGEAGCKNSFDNAPARKITRIVG